MDWPEDTPCVLGIDEAGRGPVLGAMVYSAAFCPKHSLTDLKKLGVNDSKQLTEDQRDGLRKKIEDAPFLKTITTVLTAEELSNNMLRKNKYNLNAISHDTALELVQSAIDQGFNISEIYVDTVGNSEQYAAKFRERFTEIGKVVVTKKADSIYQIVGAASIIAKTTRDKHIRTWIFPEQERSKTFQPSESNQPVQFYAQTGSGYPSDPTTKKWMAESVDKLFGFPTFVRFSWGTTKTILLKEAVPVEWECDEMDEAEEKAESKQPVAVDITSFFKPKQGKRATTPKSKKRKTTAAARSLPKFLKSRSFKRVSKIL